MDSLNLTQIGVDPLFVIEETFLGYKYRKHKNRLYIDGLSFIPTNLIRLYYGLYPEGINFDLTKKNFIKKYIENECAIEEVHDKEEIDGIREMYQYIHSDEIDDGFNIYTLKELHRILYSKVPYPEFGGKTRNDDRYLPGTGTDLCPWWMINSRLFEISPEVDLLYRYAKELRITRNVEHILDFIEKVVKLNCELILIHPFPDGNGRCIRGFTNKLLESAGLPPIYVKLNERTEYHKALNLANTEGNYEDIINFYKYKICDSIIELDIDPRLKTEDENIKLKKIGTN